jgi:hypothetical protein
MKLDHTVRQLIPVSPEHKKGWKNGKHQNQWLRTLEVYAFPTLGDILVSSIEGPAVREVLAEIWTDKPETARRVRQRIGAVLDWAYSKGHRDSEAPMRSLSKGLPRQPKKVGHHAAMPFADVPTFLARLRSLQLFPHGLHHWRDRPCNRKLCHKFRRRPV